MTAISERTAAVRIAREAANGSLSRMALVSRLGAVLVSNGAYVAGAFLSNVLIANVLTPAEFGFFSLALAVMIIVQEACGTGFDLAMVRLAASHDGRGRAAAILRVSLRIKIVVAGAASVALFLLSPAIAVDGFGDAQLIQPLRWAAAGVLTTALFHHALARRQALEDFSAYALLRSGNSLAKFVILALLALASALSLQAALATSVLILLLGFAAALVFEREGDRSRTGTSDAHLWREVLWFSRWMIASHLLFALYARIDVVMLGRFRDEAEVGFYTVAWNLSFLIDLCTYSVIMAMMPHASRLQTAADMRGYGRQTLRASGLMAVCLLPAAALAGPFIRVLFPGYLPAIGVFHVLFVGSLLTLLTHPLYLIVYARDHVALVALSNLVLAVSAGAGCWLLIPSLGIMGAAYASVIARTINAALIAYLVWRELRSSAVETPLPA